MPISQNWLKGQNMATAMRSAWPAAAARARAAWPSRRRASLLGWLETRLAQNTFNYINIAEPTLKHERLNILKGKSRAAPWSRRSSATGQWPASTAFKSCFVFRHFQMYYHYVHHHCYSDDYYYHYHS